MDVAGNIPLSRRRPCVYCRSIIDSNGPGSYVRATGWLPLGRFSNNRQGSNSLSLRKNLDEYACAECIDRLKHGIPTGQQTLFDPSGS